MASTLILGGTGWLGRRLSQKLLADGHAVTILARGVTGSPATGVDPIFVDRDLPGAYETAARHDWDEIIELSSSPTHVREALGALAPLARHWTYISSISVYAGPSRPGDDERAPLAVPSGSDYASEKIRCEQATRAALGDRSLIVRPGIIAGTGDPSDRFGYWAGRMNAAGDAPILIPETRDRFVQVIDVDDLTLWLSRVGRRGSTGFVNAVGMPQSMAAFFALTQKISRHRGALISAPDGFLEENGVRHWSGPESLPLWLPRGEEAMMLLNNSRYRLEEGLLSPLEDTIRASLAEEWARGAERERHAGLTPERERALLTLLGEAAPR